MTDKLNYKGALRELGRIEDGLYCDGGCLEALEGIYSNYLKAIKTALKIADRLQSGAATDGMIWAATQLQKGKSECASPRSVFRVMTTQLLKEIEDENAG